MKGNSQTKVQAWAVVRIGALVVMITIIAGCGGRRLEKQQRDFFTSGSREADQRASQRMAKEEQLAGSGENAGERGEKKAGDTNQAVQVEGKLALFDRLGGEQGITAIIEDFAPRALQDPRVNWQRKGMISKGLFRRRQSLEWSPTPENVAQLKKHMVQFLA